MVISSSKSAAEYRRKTNRALEEPSAKQAARWDRHWDKKIVELREYLNTGQPLPNKNSKHPLFTFVRAAKQSYRQNPDLRDSPRAQSLEAIPGWSWLSEIDLTWSAKFEQAKVWYAEHPFVDPPMRAHSGLKDLAAWVSRQKRNYETSSLCPERIQKLEAISGWHWQRPGFRSSRRSFLERELFTLLNLGIAEELTTGSVRGKNRVWQCDVILLDSLIVIEFDGKYTHRDSQEVDTRKTKDLESAGWRVLRVREVPLEKLKNTDVFYSSGDMTEAALSVLKILIEWGVPVTDENLPRYNHGIDTVYLEPDWWEYKYQTLLKHTKETGSSYVSPKDESTNATSLRGWIQTQRGCYKKKLLTEDQKLRLEFLPDWKWSVRPHRFTWEDNFINMVKLQEELGELPRGPQPNGMYPRGWKTKQKYLYHSGALNSSRIARLEALPSWTWEKD